MAVFAYTRVSTAGQTTDNQRLELEKTHPVDFWITDEGISGKVPAMQRPGFRKLLDRIRENETLVVAKLDRLGRDALDVQATIRTLQARKVRVKVLQLGDVDLTSSAGKLLLTMLSAVAEMERDLIVERTQAGLARAKAEGKALGRPSKTTPESRKAIREMLTAGKTVSETARAFGVSRATVIGIRNKAA